MIAILPSFVLRLDAAARLGARPVALHLLHSAGARLGLGRRALRDAPGPAGSFFGAGHAAAAPAIDWHGPFDGARHGLDTPLFASGDIRPVWETNRLSALTALAASGDWADAEALLADWAARNPPFRGPAWACGQECALRALTLATTLL
ncbi:MAG: heparinase, partial [Pseudomonadota bacterium]